MKKKIKPDHPPLLPHRADGAMSDRRLSLRECIEAAASSASREARERENAVNNDENDRERSETVGASIDGAAASTTDQARQDAAPVSIYPTHDTRSLNIGTRGPLGRSLEPRHILSDHSLIAWEKG